MKRPTVEERHINRDANLPYGIDVQNVVDAVEDLYDYWYEVNEWHLNHPDDYGRYHEQFRANNAIGGFISHRITVRLAEQYPALFVNRMDDGYPDLLYDGTDYEWPDNYSVKDEEGEGPGLEVKASRGNTFYAHHNVEEWLLGVHYRINARSESLTETTPAPDDVPPIEITQVLCASMDHDDWTYRDASGSNRTNTSDLKAKGGMHELRKNPIIELEDAVTGQGDLLTEYKRNHAQFDPAYADEHPEYVTGQAEIGGI
ncbi:hypothetical protein HALLA_05795 [Halostagnicola larsenii XH-48]|uniref:Uncharacterized protein n=1 Tax=Halostagnicola larsenii XH-48 TaxID=797299 RepID=W0JQ44_9EURY|nr:hypothetical protein [Halostagnicola larsenii]AHG00729.1 hypothetical protein HALLA_05795 [Halostagnicola larsenii XH-48]